MSGDPAAPMPGPDCTVGEYLEWDLVVHVEPHLRPSSVAQYRRFYASWWIPLLGKVQLSKLTHHEVQQAVDAVQAGSEMQPSTIHTGAGLLAAGLERAVRNRLLDMNPAARVRLPRRNPGAPTALTPDELGRWLDVALLPSGLGGFLWSGAMLATAPLTGLRLGELRGLRWENVDLWGAPEGDTAGMIHVTEQIDSATRGTEWSDPKSDSGVRHVPLTVDLAAVLSAQRERLERHALRRGQWKWPEHGLVFPSRNGLAIAQNSVIEARRRIAELAGLDPVPTMNCLRHTYATTLVESGMQPAQVSKLMGHADVAITIKFYFDPGPATHDSAAAAIAANYSWKDRRRRT